MEIYRRSRAPPVWCLRLFCLPAADLHAGQRHGEDKPEDAHDPGILPQVVRQAGHHTAAQCGGGGRGDGACGGISAVAQGRVAAGSINLLAKRPDDWAKGMVLCITVEFYAILSLLASLLMLINI